MPRTSRASGDGPSVPHSQTLDRGVRALEVLAASPQPMSIADLGAELGVHRSIVYRIVRTLEDHHLVSRADGGRLEPGVGLSVLARSVKASLQTAALPELSDLSYDLAMTSFLVVREEEEAVTVQSVEPRHSSVHVFYRPGVRHPVGRGAPGLALLAGEPAAQDERPEIAEARARGWVTTSGEVLTGMRAVSAPVVTARGEPVGAVSVVFVDSSRSLAEIGARVKGAADAIARELP